MREMGIENEIFRRIWMSSEEDLFEQSSDGDLWITFVIRLIRSINGV